ncbi:MAG: hypothetical protein ACRDNK_02920, partial [Solirubrobacteraceae bacterium]
FGDLVGTVWGAAMDAGEPAIVFGTSAASEAVAGPEHVHFLVEGDRWHLTGSGFDLMVSAPEPLADAPPPPDSAPLADAPPLADTAPLAGATSPVGAEPNGAGGDELCAVTGIVTVSGSEQTIDCLGTRTTDPDFELDGLDSLRSVAGWFGPHRGVTLRALRPRPGRDQGEDRIAATLFEPEGPIDVDEPRLSTTYVSTDRPARASLELWIGAGEEQYPRRAAGEALGEGGAAKGDLVTFGVTPLRCHASGLEGAGVYLLARF